MAGKILRGAIQEYGHAQGRCPPGGASEDVRPTVRVKGILKAELKRRNVSYRQLAVSLQALGIHETERNINNKISRGGFTAVFVVQCLL